SLRVLILGFAAADLDARFEELLLAKVEHGDQWAVSRLTALYERQERFTELREHLRHQVYLGSPTAAADLVDHLGHVDDYADVYEDLAWPLASFARSGGEMGASKHMSYHLSSDEMNRFHAEAAEAGDGAARLSLAESLLVDGRAEEAQEVFT